MRTLAFFTLTLAACSSNNPFFGLDTDTTGSSGGTTTTAATTANPTTTEDPPTTTPPDTTTEPMTTAGPTTESPTAPVTSTTGIDPDTSTGVAESSSSSGSSTGAESCELTKNLEFSGFLFKNGVPLEQCPNVGFSYFPNTKLLKGDGPLRLGNCTNPAEPELSIGKGYDLPVPKDSPCGKLYLFRDGDNATCDIGHFYFLAGGAPYAAGSFTPEEPAINPPVELTMLVEEVLSQECCATDGLDCCDETLGNYSLVFPTVEDPIPPGIRIDGVPGEAGAVLSILNIQAWHAPVCDPNEPISNARDWAAVRTN